VFPLPMLLLILLTDEVAPNAVVACVLMTKETASKRSEKLKKNWKKTSQP